MFFMTVGKNLATEAELVRDARQLAVHLSRVLAASALPAEQKAAWAVLIPEMRLDQLSRLASILDTFLEQAVKVDLADTIKTMQTIVDKYAAKQAQIDNAFMTDLTGMVQQLRRVETAGASAN